MCGICGILNFEKTNKAPSELIRRMCGAMAHRGPDGEGFYFENNVALGHRRLAVIDLETGQQPMSNEDNSIFIVYNGEIYNYIEIALALKDKGHKFKTQSDTEVILHLYEEYGEDCLGYLNGMFAFAVWDSRNKLFFAARDRMGIKPFCYYRDKSRFVFASEIKAILEDDTIQRLPNHRAVAQYLRHMYSINEETFFSGINKLLPGHFLKIKDGAVKITRYWQPFFRELRQADEDEAAAQLRGFLNDAVRLHLRSDVPVGAHLSGGLDSGTIVALAQRYLNGGIKSFSVAFDNAPEHDERPYIQIMTRHFKTDHYEYIPTARESLEAIPAIVKAMDEPQAGSGILGQYFLCRLVSRSVKVVLGGQGGDELFGGYYRYLPFFLRETFKNDGFAGIMKQIPGVFAYVGRVGGLSNMLQKMRRRTGLLRAATVDYLEAYGQDILSGGGPLWDTQNFLPALLQIEDRTSMAFSVESRVPLLDYRLVEFSLGLSLQLKMKDAQLKYLLRRAVAGLLPENILLRKQKQGFSAPINRWFRKEMRSFVEQTLRSGKMRQRKIFDPRVVDGMLKAHMSGAKDLSEQLWMLLMVELWFREFMDN